jgi:hypothetical protein
LDKNLIHSKLLLEYHAIIIDDFSRILKINELINKNIGLFTQIQIINHLNNLDNSKYIESIKLYKSKDNPLPIEFLLKFHIEKEVQREVTNEIKIPEFIRNMCLVYLISSFENFVKNCLRLYYFIEPNALKSKKTLDYELIINSKSREEIISIIIEKELTEIFYKSIDDANDYLKNKISLDLKQNPKWNAFRERFFRRNILTHNDGISNSTYSSKMNKDELGKSLTVNTNYLGETVILFTEFNQLIYDFFNNRIKK